MRDWRRARPATRSGRCTACRSRRRTRSTRRGLVTTAGTVGWRDRVPERDATVVARLRDAGAILLGKTNTPEFTWSDETDNDVYGRTSNPYDLERTPGGSSGGAAAIVAAGGSPFDIGSDTGDSIRQPAHVCGIAGIKPTSGRVPRTGHWPSFAGITGPLTQLGPLARRVDDLGARSCRSSPGRTARTRTSRRSRSAARTTSTWRRCASSPSPTTASGRRQPRRSSRSRRPRPPCPTPARSSSGRFRRASPRPGTRGTG